MTRTRKVGLLLILAVVLALHIALFAAGSKWRKMGLALIAVDAVSGLFIAGALREMRKLG